MTIPGFPETTLPDQLGLRTAIPSPSDTFWRKTGLFTGRNSTLGLPGGFPRRFRRVFRHFCPFYHHFCHFYATFDHFVTFGPILARFLLLWPDSCSILARFLLFWPDSGFPGPILASRGVPGPILPSRGVPECQKVTIPGFPGGSQTSRRGGSQLGQTLAESPAS